MAKIIGKFIRGAIGDAVFKKHGDMQLLMAKPRKGRRTAGSKKSSSLFGLASNFACEFRLGLSMLVTSFYDGTMTFRLNGEVVRSIGYANNPETGAFSFSESSFDNLDGFEFNIKSPLSKSLLALPTVEFSEPTLTVSLPALEIPKDLKFPKGATSCKILIGRTLSDLSNQRRKFDFVSFEILNKKGVSLPQSWEFETEPGCVCITAISLQFVKSVLAGETIINSKTFNPSAILNALVLPGTALKSRTKSWSKTRTKNIKIV
ncbi:MAG: hypothetical protein EOP48_14085 [Sphingobacteriales bacterium]|nr:MAG: hypothetical protein EOP48_14085 [Sphingobacteriales bacterium]